MMSIRPLFSKIFSGALVALVAFTLMKPTVARAQATEAQYIKDEVVAGAWLKPSHRPLFQKFYGDRGYAAVWTSNGQLTQRAIELRAAVLRVVPAHGLKMKDYWTPQIESFFRPNFDVRAWLAAEMA
ncbi:MAG: hypothetical protein AAB250_04760, partial [Bdellovibrionota bacterium]